MAKFNKKDANKSRATNKSRGRKTEGNFRKEKDPVQYNSTGGYSVPSKNDMAWYDHHPELTQAVAKIPYPYKPGMLMHPKWSLRMDTAGDVNYATQDYIPGVCTLNFLPSVGQSMSVNSPASIAAREIYAKVRSKFSGTLAADAVDLMIYTMAIDSIYAYIGWLRRLYRTINAFTPQNYILPNAVMVSMGLTNAQINQLRVDRVNLWNVINTLSLDVNKFTLPGTMDIFKRHYWLNSNIYTDCDIEASQLYLFNQIGFYKFALDEESAGKLEMTPFDPSTYSDNTIVKDLADYGNALLSALNNSEDAYTINGYLQRAYEGESFFNLDLLKQDDVVSPVYSEEVLMQIENSHAALPTEQIDYWRTKFISGGDTSSWDITQDPSSNTIKHIPGVGLQDAPNSTEFTIDVDGAYLNMRKEAPDVNDNVIATRLLTRLIKGTTNYTIKCGSEALLYYGVFSYDGVLDGTGLQSVARHYLGNNITLRAVDDDDLKCVIDLTDLRALSILNHFKYHPTFYVAAKWNLMGSMRRASLPMFDVRNLGYISYEECDEIDRVCLYSLMNSF